MRPWRDSCIVLAGLALTMAIMRRLAQLSRGSHAAGRALSVTPYKCPVPAVIHQRIDHVKPGRLIIVGDCHGTPELFRLLDKLQYNIATDNLVLAGDLVNKGPVSRDILDAVPKLGCWAVRGNHDDAVLSAWLQFRAGQQLNPKFEWVRNMTDEEAAILLRLPFTVSIPEYGIVVVHAGFVPAVPIAHQDMWVMYKVRNVVLEGEEQEPTHRSATETSSGGKRLDVTPRYRPIEKAKDGGGEAWGALWRGPPHVFFGHDAVRRLQLHPHATGLDTGCVYGGQLTAAVMPPLADLHKRSPAFVAKMRLGEAVSREDLMVELVAVDAAEVYSPPGAVPT
ncbi:hypothetical protein Vafri_1513 [Volvox africanus]|nr:hypothetical protein Vafri_1513 [Volvox africanus]